MPFNLTKLHIQISGEKKNIVKEGKKTLDTYFKYFCQQCLNIKHWYYEWTLKVSKILGL